MNIRKMIEQAICEHMPSAAVASGWMSATDPTPFVKGMSLRFPYAARPTDLGLTALSNWLKGQGVEAGASFIRKLREEWLWDVLRVESGGQPKDWNAP